MTLAQFRKRELQAKLTSLDQDLTDWVGKTSKPPLSRHRSQMLRAEAKIRGLLSIFEGNQQWTDAKEDTILAKAASWEKLVLTAHSVWDAFRGKLALRLEPRFAETLAACDDLVWECYEPALQRFLPGHKKEPPLVYLNSTWSPFLRKRETPFAQEIVEGLDAEKEKDPELVKTLEQLPVPLLGLPWFQVNHLPSALLIAHEVGHAVESDFGLRDAIRDALDAALSDPYEWKLCASEVFADLYGCLCMGKYLAAAVLDIMVASKDAVAQDTAFGRYPPRATRAGLLVEALTQLGQVAAAGEIRARWESVYGAIDSSPDVRSVVKAIYDGLGLKTLMGLPGDVQDLADNAGDGANIANETNARRLFCAAREVYERGFENQMKKAAPLLVRQIVNGQKAQFRYRGAPVKDEAALKNKLQNDLKEDFNLGVAWRKQLGLDLD